MRLYYYKKLSLAWAVLFIVGLALCHSSFCATNTDQDNMKEIKSIVFNFDEVEPGFYRSGLLSTEAYPLIQKLGIKTVVNFIDRPCSQCAGEKESLQKLGVEMISIPWNGFDRPKDADVEKFLSIARDASKRPILIHCKRGAERTGVMVACWRIAEQKWTAARAVQEMKDHHFRHFWYGHLTRYVYDFAKRYGQTEEYSNNIVTQAKVNVLYGLYRFRKLNPFLWLNHSCNL